MAKVENKLNRKFKAKWVKALLSKRYKQGTGVLHRLNPWMEKFCCLGVACKVARLPWQDRGAARSYYSPRNGMAKDYSIYRLPHAFRTKIGLSRAAENKLMRLNDDKGYDFEQIAAWIQEHL